ncbi:endolytic transglycosylase MltG [Poseidonibacter lekithochrous]|uniref:endolytic transglycosylase MltG n=1 Tax=Poseidonibacter lekithochrous TaxID=1904463 RepID=UPI0009F89C28|nr:endolytic transglycosylase MltG [Poseidonibacter lekithochrous]QKJ23382.1 YceG-like protein [Poseidonibacter lekithochrous]
MPDNNTEANKIIVNKRKPNKSLVIFNIIEFILITCIVVLFYITIPLTSTKVLFIPKGSTSNIISYLDKSGFELNIVDKVVLRSLGFIQSGWINIDKNHLTKMDFLYKLTTSKAALKNVTLIPGETSYIFLKQLANKLDLSEDKLVKTYKKYAYKADGNIIADTYSLPYGMKEEHLVLYLLTQTNKKYESFSKKIFGLYDKKKWYYYISLASVIQKEAASKDEMPIVSSVVHNRLRRGMKLQMDGTLNYGKYSHIKVTAKRIKEDNSSYNTYKNRGLPKNPVSAVSLDAIKAAIFPVKSKYLYFVKDNKTGLHKFSKSYKEHINNIKANRGVKKSYTKIKAVESKIDKEAKSIMKTDVSKQKPTSIKSLWNNVK